MKLPEGVLLLSQQVYKQKILQAFEADENNKSLEDLIDYSHMLLYLIILLYDSVAAFLTLHDHPDTSLMVTTSYTPCCMPRLFDQNVENQTCPSCHGTYNTISQNRGILLFIEFGIPSRCQLGVIPILIYYSQTVDHSVFLMDS